MLWSELAKVGWHQASNPFRQQQQPAQNPEAAAGEQNMLYFAPTGTGCVQGNKNSQSTTAGAVLDSKAAVFRFLAKASRSMSSGHAKSDRR